jgi:PTS system nitrogen regulatory IIA component
MRIVDILAEDLIVPDLRATTKHEVLDALCARVSEVRPDVDHDVALRVLEDRERLGSTGVGNGFAVPHGKLGQLDRVVACFARSRDGVAFDALDG